MPTAGAALSRPRRLLLGAYEVPGYGGAATTGYQLFERLLREEGAGPATHPPNGAAPPLSPATPPAPVPAPILAPTWVNLVTEGDAEYFRFALGPTAGNPSDLPDVHTCRLAAPIFGEQPGLAELVAGVDPEVLLAKGHVAAWLLRRAAPDRPLIFVTTGSRSLKVALAEGRLADAASLEPILRDDRPLPFDVQRFEREAVEGADLVVTHSTLVRDLYARMFRDQRGKLHPVVAWDVPGLGAATGPADVAVPPWERRDIDWIAVASSWSRPEKNLPLLRRLLARRGGTRAHVVGELPGADAAALSADGAVCHGLVTADVLAVLLRRARVLVCPSAFDATPGILFEASLAGCNLVASRNCGAHAVCAHGLLAEPPDEAGFVAALDRALTGPVPDRRLQFDAIYPYVELRDLARVL